MIALLSLFAVSAVAADISGKWTSEAPGRDGTPQVTTYTFTVSGTTLTGKVTGTRGGQETSQDITEGTVAGDEIGFVVVRTMGDMTMKTTYKGKVAGSEIHLTREMAMPPGGGAPGGGGGRGPTEIVLKRAS
jgi:hypothetical protein